LRIFEHFSPASLVVIIITFILFTVALFVTGFTHDLLIESGVFLVSVKLIIMTYRNSIGMKKLEEKLDEIYIAVQRLHEGEK
jgi:hypothetical protein